MLKTWINRDFYVSPRSLFETSRLLKKKKPYTRSAVYLILGVISVLFVYAGCSASWSPSDDEAVRLVKGHYLFYRGGKEINAEIIYRGEFVKECKCYPVKLKIIDPENRSHERTFYFFKNKSGKVDVREHELGMK